jgi:roadblock/LC7 domain-containing protein
MSNLKSLISIASLMAAGQILSDNKLPYHYEKPLVQNKRKPIKVVCSCGNTFKVSGGFIYAYCECGKTLKVK